MPDIANRGPQRSRSRRRTCRSDPYTFDPVKFEAADLLDNRSPAAPFPPRNQPLIALNLPKSRQKTGHRSRLGRSPIFCRKNRKSHKPFWFMALTKMEIRGLEPLATPQNPAEMGGVSEKALQNALHNLPNDLQRVIEAWPKLGVTLQAAVLAVIFSRERE